MLGSPRPASFHPLDTLQTSLVSAGGRTRPGSPGPGGSCAGGADSGWQDRSALSHGRESTRRGNTRNDFMPREMAPA